MPHLDTHDLRIAFNESGARHGHPVLLLHGWPDDASTWNAVSSSLRDRDLRLIAPYLRGFGETVFRDHKTLRTANGAILAMDAIALMDGLGIEEFSVVGHDWGSNIAEALAIGWPHRVVRMALLSSLPRMGGLKTPPFRQAQRYWYHWFMATKRGAEAIRKDPHGLARIQWENWSPSGWFDEATFQAVSKSFDNPDWVAVTLHSYRVRWGEADPDPESAWLEDRIRETQSLSLPTVYFQGLEDGVNPSELSEDLHKKFSGPFDRIALQNVGHSRRERTRKRSRGSLPSSSSGKRGTSYRLKPLSETPQRRTP
jgi:pimeloyl-ACP methyl ester carboxylesterase